MKDNMPNDIKIYFLQLQDTICQALENEDKQTKFHQDEWQYQHGSGGGRTRVIDQGTVFEKAGVNFSHVWGKQLPAAATQHRPELANSQFQTMGVSLVIHPNNPFVPTCHANWRFFIAETPQKQTIWWFGGGYDLTPYYGFIEDCQHWHQTAKNACAPFGEDIYPHFKKWCDEYFFIKHRQEPRGIGGLFFDDFNRWEFDRCFALVQNIANSFIPAYQPIIARRKDHPYQQQHRDFQLYRRGRYVEFNLIYDRGTIFGLQSQGRTESILMSLPPLVTWKYNWQPAPESEEAKLYNFYLQPRAWV